ncbi:hypothetical protein D3C87_1307620 [compost metagenome]
MNRRREYVLHQACTQFKHRKALERIGLGPRRGFPCNIALLFRNLGLVHQTFENRTIRVVFIRPRQRMPGQLNAFRQLEQHPKTRRVTDNSRIYHRHGIQINAQQLVQHMTRPLHIVNVQGADTTRPKHDAQVVVWISLPECFGCRWVGDEPARLVPALALWRLFTRLNGYQGETEGVDVTFCPSGDAYSFGRFTHRRASRNP